MKKYCEICGNIAGSEEITEENSIRSDAAIAVNTVLDSHGAVIGSQCRSCGANWYDKDPMVQVWDDILSEPTDVITVKTEPPNRGRVFYIGGSQYLIAVVIVLPDTEYVVYKTTDVGEISEPFIQTQGSTK